MLACVFALASPAADAHGQTHGVSLPVVACKMSDTQPVSIGAPRQLRAKVPVALASKLTFYAAATLVVLAPRGWSCSGGLSPEGGVSMLVSNPRAGSFRIGQRIALPQQAVSVEAAAAETSQPLFIACAYFRDAAVRLARASLACARTPGQRGETGTRSDPHTYTFQDLARVSGTGYPSGGRNPAQGFVVWLPTLDASLTATCTLPAAYGADCTAILASLHASWLSNTA